MIISPTHLTTAIKAVALTASLLSVTLLPLRSASADAPRKERQGNGTKDREKRSSSRVNQIFIIGNTVCSQSFILRQLPFKPGDTFTSADLRVAERKLASLKVFLADPAPSVRVADSESDSTFKDIFVDVYERPINVYFWPFEESVEFATIWVDRGLLAAILETDGFPKEFLRFALTGDTNECPYVISQFFTRWTGVEALK